jgi:hypothetical protein
MRIPSPPTAFFPVHHDVRFPIRDLFFSLGLVWIGDGFFSNRAIAVQDSLGQNVNLLCSPPFVAFGRLMLWRAEQAS